MNTTLQKILDRCNAATDKDEPDYIAIHSATQVKTAKWDTWAVEQAEMLKRHGWVEKRIGTGLHLQHPFLIGVPA